MLYFAYGSNMNWRQMQERCPSTCFVCRATLPDHKLAVTHRSPTRGCGVVSAVPEADRSVWGVVYDVADLEIDVLDGFEGYQPGRRNNAYVRRECLVLRDGDPQRPMIVSSYFGAADVSPPLPNAEYKQLIVSGARHWRLPQMYVRELETIDVCE